MLHINELEALENIILLIKTYRHQTGDCRDLASNRDIDAYLSKHLSDREYVFWQNRQTDLATLSGDLLSLQQFELLLKQYKRAGYELYQFWHQSSSQLTSNI